jgi:hypothetical protein
MARIQGTVTETIETFIPRTRRRVKMAEEVKKITQRGVYVRLKRLLAADTGLEPKDIEADDELRGEKLGYTEPGVAGLTKPINKEFSDVELKKTPPEVCAAETVRDLKNIIWEQVPPEHKAE